MMTSAAHAKFGKLLGSGNIVEVKSKNSEKYERGIVCCYDEKFQMLILKTQAEYSNTQKLFDVNVYNLDHVEDIQRISETSKTEPTPHVDVGAVSQRLDEAYRRRESRLKGPEPPADCIKVFVKLKEQFGGRSVKLAEDNQSIIFMDTVRIRDPYTVDSCEFLNASSNTLPPDSSDKIHQTLNFARTQLTKARQQLGLPSTVAVEN